MIPEERQLLADLFDRVRAAEGNPRDGEAEAYIAAAVAAQPHAPYLLAQTVIVQEHALRAANERLQQLEAQVRDLQRAAAPSQGSSSFLGGLGKSLFAPEPAPAAPPPRASVPPSGPWGTQAASAPVPPAQPHWPGMPQAPGGGGFLHSALGAAAGVAGGVLLADSIRGLFSAHTNPFGIGSGLGGIPTGGYAPAGMAGETVINNYYEGGDAGQSLGQPADAGPYDDGATISDADIADSSGDWNGGDGTMDV